VSKKRDKNARKKAVKKKQKAPAPSSEVPIDRPPDIELRDWDAEFVEPEVAIGAAASSGGGALAGIRSAVSPRKGSDGDTLLTRRRSVPELMVWLAGAVLVIWLVWQIVLSMRPEAI
jgi:hypothetical protein